MKTLLKGIVLCLFSSLLWAQLDLRMFQYPVQAAKDSANSSYPKFCGYLTDKGGKPRLAGLTADQIRTVRHKYRIKTMNEHRLYTDSPMEQDEKILLETYCTRYNRTLLRELGL